MNDDAMKYIIGQAISNILSETGNAYATLTEIYNEVSNIKNEPISEGLKSQVRGRLQECCSQYDNYLGKDDFFQTKGKYSGLWKNKITGENELTPYINNIIKQYPGIDTVTLKSKLYEIINLTPGDKAISLTRNGEMKIDQIMRNFVSHKDSHEAIRFEANGRTYKMYFEGEEGEVIDTDLCENITQDDNVYKIIFAENEKPEENTADIKLSFVFDELVPKKVKNMDSKVFIRKNDINTWIKREKSRIKNGNLAESLVYASEKEKLRKLHRDDLAEKVKWISRDSGDGYGYDILSYELDENNQGNEIYIEVKSTSNLNDDFIMSANELKFAREHLDKYRLYRVAKLKSNNPICRIVYGNLDNVFNFDSNEFKVSIKSDN